jgi:hypothetical protein
MLLKVLSKASRFYFKILATPEKIFISFEERIPVRFCFARLRSCSVLWYP